MTGVSGVQAYTANRSMTEPSTNAATSRVMKHEGVEASVPKTNSPAYALDLSGKVDAVRKNDKTDPQVRQLKRTGQIECQTCKERKYQDGSNDPGVSFKAPGHISPESAGSVVMAHEQEHVSNEKAKAAGEDRRVVAQSVRIFTSVCPECGKVYVSGGETRTTTASDPKAQAQQNQNNKVDMKV